MMTNPAQVYKGMAETVPQLRRGIVWCVQCCASAKLDSAHCLAHGWPKHCGQTMTIDSPEERAKR